jgi:sulfite exporter TauE/SafE
MSQIWLAFITGLTTGGISCFAVQGGLLASSLARQDKQNQKSAIGLFLVAKLVAYTILGAGLGLLGSKLVFSPTLQGWMQIIAGLFMIITVGKILDLHPIFRKFTLTPPKSLFRIVRSKSLNDGVFSSGILGSLTILIPCGVTQAMMLLAVASGSPFYGALIMAGFTLGTSPVFFILGLASGEILKRNSLKILASGVILTLGILSINTGQILRGSAHTLENYIAVATNKAENRDPGVIAGVTAEGKQEVEIKVNSGGYVANVQTLKAGVPVSLKLVTNNVFSCARAFVIPEYGISQVLPVNGVTNLEFTPTKKGRLAFSCSMGMYTGFFNVI